MATNNRKEASLYPENGIDSLFILEQPELYKKPWPVLNNPKPILNIINKYKKNNTQISTTTPRVIRRNASTKAPSPPTQNDQSHSLPPFHKVKPHPLVPFYSGNPLRCRLIVLPGVEEEVNGTKAVAIPTLPTQQKETPHALPPRGKTQQKETTPPLQTPPKVKTPHLKLAYTPLTKKIEVGGDTRKHPREEEDKTQSNRKEQRTLEPSPNPLPNGSTTDMQGILTTPYTHNPYPHTPTQYRHQKVWKWKIVRSHHKMAVRPRPTRPHLTNPATTQSPPQRKNSTGKETSYKSHAELSMKVNNTPPPVPNRQSRIPPC